MREIKFRAWDGYADSMIEWDELTRPVTKHRSLINLLLSLPQDHKSVLMQFTGFKDVNGKEIYEGDIVMFENDIPGGLYEPPEPHNDFAIVEWSDEGRWHLNADSKDNCSTSADWFHEYDGALEVISNMYEDHEGILATFKQAA